MRAEGGMRTGVVIPNWNGARWLEACLDSVAAQTAPPSGAAKIPSEEAISRIAASASSSVTVSAVPRELRSNPRISESAIAAGTRSPLMRV